MLCNRVSMNGSAMVPMIENENLNMSEINQNDSTDVKSMKCFK